MNVLFLAPSYPAEMPHFVRGLAQLGASVWGVGDQPVGALAADVKRHLSDYLQVPHLLDEQDMLRRILPWLRGREVHRVEALWEPLVVLAARLREQLGIPGMSVDTVSGFRDKQLMKERIKHAGLRVPKSRRARSVQEVRDAITDIGYPIILKPIAGAGTADTYKVDDEAQLTRILPALQHVPEVSCEEFIAGEELTFDALCVEGTPVYHSVTQYSPPPLQSRTKEWISPAQITFRDLKQPQLQGGVALGHQVVKALGMGTGFVHMEWFRKHDGEVVFGEIACRPGGGRLMDQINYASDIDIFTQWARVACGLPFDAPLQRLYNVSAIFKRAQGQGRIHHIEGLDPYRETYRPWICTEQFLPIGAPRRDWKQTLLGDGFVIVRHPDLEFTRKMTHQAVNHIRLFAR